MAMRVLALLVVALVAMASGRPTKQTAVAFMRDTNPTQNLIIGEVRFFQDFEGGDVLVQPFIYGNEDFLVADANHGMFVSQTGDITKRDASATGNAFYFLGVGVPTHGCPPSETRRTGDMGNFPVNSLHQLMGSKTMDLLETYNSTASIIGRAVILASAEDTCEQGWAPIPIAFGTIGFAEGFPSGVGSTLALSSRGLVAWIYGSSDCLDCNGEIWATQETDNTIRIEARVLLPAGSPDSHLFQITQYGDITTKNGELMGGVWSENGVNRGNLGNSQYYSPYNAEQSFANKWLNKTIVGTLSEINGRGIRIFESYERGASAGCRGFGAGEIAGFGVFGLAEFANQPPNSFPGNVIPVDFPLDNSFCASGVLGVSFTSLVGLLLAWFVVM